MQGLFKDWEGSSSPWYPRRKKAITLKMVLENKEKGSLKNLSLKKDLCGKEHAATIRGCLFVCCDLCSYE